MKVVKVRKRVFSMHLAARLSAVHSWAWLCVIHLPVAILWSCTLSLLGSSDQPRNLSLVQTTLLCSPDVGDVGTLMPVGFDDRLPWRCLDDDIVFSPSQIHTWRTNNPVERLAVLILLQQAAIVEWMLNSLCVVDTLLLNCRCGCPAPAC